MESENVVSLQEGRDVAALIKEIEETTGKSLSYVSISQLMPNGDHVRLINFSFAEQKKT